jgi:hypothetical protein
VGKRKEKKSLPPESQKKAEKPLILAHPDPEPSIFCQVVPPNAVKAFTEKRLKQGTTTTIQPGCILLYH